MAPAVLLLAAFALQQPLPPVSEANDYARLHEGVKPPTLLHSIDPEYTPQAEAQGIEGSVVVEAVIDRQGNVAYASVLSPLPAGLDEKALSALKHWKYTPGVMDAEDIPVLMPIDVLFRLPYKADNLQREQREGDVQAIASRTSASGAAPSAADIRELKELANKGSSAAMGFLGKWYFEGLGVAKDSKLGLMQLQQAAMAGDPKSLYAIGRWELEGRVLPKNEAQGWDTMRRAAWLGDADAQMFLGDRYVRENNSNEAQRYFRLCAATAHAICECQLGKLLTTGPGLTPNRFSQGVTWLELAKDHGDRQAAALWASAVSKLSSVQLEWVAKLKPHLELARHRGF